MNESNDQKYEDIFDTPYMTGLVGFFAKKISCELVSEIVPCGCCLCKWRVKSKVSYEFCIKMHPCKLECGNGKLRKKETQAMNLRRSICELCIDTMIQISEKVKATRRYRCFIDTCDKCTESGLTKSNIEKHFYGHTGLKKFLCSFPNCNEGYATKITMKKHENSHYILKLKEN